MYKYKAHRTNISTHAQRDEIRSNIVQILRFISDGGVVYLNRVNCRVREVSPFFLNRRMCVFVRHSYEYEYLFIDYPPSQIITTPFYKHINLSIQYSILLRNSDYRKEYELN